MEFLIIVGIVFGVELLILVPLLTISYIRLSRRVSKLEKNLSKSHVEADVKRANFDSLHKNSRLEESENNEALLVYIKKELEVGTGQEEIFEALAKNGWERGVVAEAFVKIGKDKLVEERQTQDSFHNDFEENKPSSFDHLIKWLSTDWLMKVGALLIIIGLGWFTSYAFLNNWIGPLGRITIGFLVGVSVLLLGENRIRKFVNQGAVMLSLGASIILITTFAAQEVYGLFTPVIALIITFITVAFLALSSVRHKSRSLAILSVVLGSFAPLFTAGDISSVTMFPYLLFVSVGTLWIVAITGWRFLAPISLAIVVLFSAGWILDGISDYEKTLTLLCSSVFATLYFITNVTAMIKSAKIEQSDLFVAITNGLLLLWWINAVVPKEFLSLVTAAWAVVFSLAAFGIFKATRRREPFFIYAAVAAGMLAAATAFELSGPALIMAYIFEIGLVVFVTGFALKSISTAQSLSFLLIFPAILSFESITSNAWRVGAGGVLHGDFFVLTSLAVVLLGLGAFFHSKRNIEHDPPSSENTSTLIVFGSIYVLILIWLVSHSLFISSFATTLSLVIYTLIGLFLYINGQTREIKKLKNSGSVLIGFVILRLLFVEIWTLDLVGKIVVFILVGALLISSVYMGRGRLKGNNLKEENEKK